MRVKTAGALLLAACVIVLSALIAVPSSSNPATEVTTFRPSLPATGGQQTGYCWTESIAANRSGAWRCMHANMIYDPCFEVSGRSKQMVCGADPVKHENGFRLILTKPLPARPRHKAPLRPWLLQLADGSVCEAETGTMTVIEAEPVRYPCNSPSAKRSKEPEVYCGLLETLYPAKVWRADQVCFTAMPSENGPPFQLQKRATVVIRRMWE